MKLCLNIVGDTLFSILAGATDSLAEALPPASLPNEPVTWEIVRLPPHPRPESLLSYPERPSVLLLDARAPGLPEKIHALDQRELPLLRNPPLLPIVPAPVILVFPSLRELAETPDFPDFVSDWLCMPLALPDLARRVVSALKRKNLLGNRLCFGALVLLPELRALAYKGEKAQLTPSEFALAELFLSQVGAVISMPDLVRLFKASGKSTGGSNIRVTVFQLRLKLEMLTRSQYTLASVYRQGYCLKAKHKPINAAARAGKTAPK